MPKQSNRIRVEVTRDIYVTNCLFWVTRAQGLLSARTSTLATPMMLNIRFCHYSRILDTSERSVLDIKSRHIVAARLPT